MNWTLIVIIAMDKRAAADDDDGAAAQTPQARTQTALLKFPRNWL